LIDEFAIGKNKIKLHYGRQWYCTRCIDNKMIEKSKFYKENGTKGYGYFAHEEHKTRQVGLDWEKLTQIAQGKRV
jgi:hypothetical protein